MMQVVLLLACFAGLVFLQCRFGQIPLAIAPAATVGGLIGILFCADFAGMLAPTTYLLYVTGWGGALYFLYSAAQGRRFNPEPDAVILAGAAVVVYLWFYRVNSGGAYLAWDEFSHWGSIIKAIYGANTFHFEPNPLYFQDYPPGTALFSYFVLKLLGYSEGGAYFSYAVILLAFALPVIGLIAKHGLPWVIGYGVVALGLISTKGLGQGWSTTGIDHVLSVMFGGSVAGYFLLRRDGARLWPVSLMLVALVLTKHAGQSLGLLVVAICTVDLMVCESVKANSPHFHWPSARHMGRIGLTAAGLLLPMLLIGWVWKQYVVETGLIQSFGRHGLLQLLAQSAECCTGEKDLRVVTGFVDKFLGLPIHDHVSGGGSLVSVALSHLASRVSGVSAAARYAPVSLFGFLAIVGIGAVLLARDFRERVRLAVATLILSLGAVAFSLSLLLFYLYGLSEYEARILASFDRFQRTYYLGWALAAMAVVALAMKTRPDRPVPRTSTLVAMLLVFLLPLAVVNDQMLRRLHLSANGMSEVRAAIREWAVPQLDRIPLSASVYIVWQGTSGLEFWMVRHEALPRLANKVCFSLGPPHFKGDIWSCPLDEGKFAGTLRDYQYLIVAHGLADLKANYPSLLRAVPQGVDRGLLQIEQSPADRGLSLNYLPNGT